MPLGSNNAFRHQTAARYLMSQPALDRRPVPNHNLPIQLIFDFFTDSTISSDEFNMCNNRMTSILSHNYLIYVCNI